MLYDGSTECAVADLGRLLTDPALDPALLQGPRDRTRPSSMLVDEPVPDPDHGMPLFAVRVQVSLHHLVDRRLERVQLRRPRRLFARLGPCRGRDPDDRVPPDPVFLLERGPTSRAGIRQVTA